MRNKLSAAQYSLWLDEHTLKEAVKFIKTAAEAGSSKIAGKPDGVAVVALVKRLADRALVD